MASKYQFQAKSSSNGALYSWLSLTYDFAAAGYAGPGVAIDVALMGGGLDNSASASTYQVTAGGVGVTAGGVPVTATPPLVTAGGVQVTAAGANVTASS